jgi:tetratricopeptide (TPR) repeat protein
MSEGLATLHEGINMASRNGDLFWHPRMPNCIGWIHRELHDFAGAFKHDQEGLEIGHQHHVNEAEANSLINLGIDYSHSGDFAETTSAFHQVREIFDRDAWFRWRYNIRLHAAMAEHALRQGDTAKSLEITNRLLETATKYGVHKYIAVSHKLMAEIAIAEGDNATAESEFGIALEELEKYPVPVVAWRIYAQLGQLRSTSGDREGAREAFGRAAAIVEDIAKSVDDDELREGFLASDTVRKIMSAVDR